MSVLNNLPKDLLIKIIAIVEQRKDEEYINKLQNCALNAEICSHCGNIYSTLHEWKIYNNSAGFRCYYCKYCCTQDSDLYKTFDLNVAKLPNTPFKK